MKSADKSKTDTIADDQSYISLVGLISAHAQLAVRLAEMQNIADMTLQDAAELMRVEHATLQERQGALEGQIELIVRQHPEWFEKRKSIVTPGGTVKLTSTTSLEVANEELSITLLETHFGSENECEAYLRRKTTLNLEALEQLDDTDLKRLKIRRVTADKFSVTPAKVNLGKAVAKAAEVAK